MKILITTDFFAPAINGIVMSVINLQRELIHMGHEVRILTLASSKYSYCCANVTYIGSISAARIYPGARIRTSPARKYIKELVKWNPDIIHSQCELSTFFIARRIACRLGIPIVHTYHTVYEDYTHYFSPVRRWGKRVVGTLTYIHARKTSCIVVPTEKVRTLLNSYGIFRDIRVIPSGIDLSCFHRSFDPQHIAALKTQLGIPKENWVLLYIGRLAEEKNIAELVEYVNALQRSDISLLIVGDGPLRQALKRQAEQKSLPVTFTGMVPPDQIPDYYHIGDLFVNASTSETQGFTYMEALASGLPILCRKDSCLNQIVFEGVNGWQYETEKDFTQRVLVYLLDNDLRLYMSRNARLLSSSFSSELFAKEIESLYMEQLRRARAKDEGK